MSISSKMAQVNISIYNCYNLRSFFIPDTIRSLGDNPFADCYNLKEIIVSPDHPALEVIDGVLFSKKEKRLVCYLRTFTASEYIVPDGVFTIGNSAFTKNEKLENVKIPNSVTSIGNNAFYYCKSLTNINIPESVTEIGKSAFGSCSKLTNIIIPNSVTRIGAAAFCFCDGLTSITIPNSVVCIESNPISYCRNLKEIIVSADHPALEIIDGVLFSKGGKCLISYPCALPSGEYVIPQGTLMIANSAFAHCSNLTTITIPDSVTKIGDRAFSACSGLTSIAIPGSVISIGQDIFEACHDVSVIVDRGSYAAQYCDEEEIDYEEQ